jgi:hypothetical protein
VFLSGSKHSLKDRGGFYGTSELIAKDRLGGVSGGTFMAGDADRSKKWMVRKRTSFYLAVDLHLACLEREVKHPLLVRDWMAACNMIAAKVQDVRRATR